MKTEAQIRNETIEECAHQVDLMAGEMFCDGPSYHYMAERLRKFKTPEPPPSVPPPAMPRAGEHSVNPVNPVP